MSNRSPRQSFVLLLGTAGIAVAAIVPTIGQNAASGPVARYDMRAGTVTGMGAMGGGMGGAMAMMFGGGGGAQHELLLRLGSDRTPDKGKPKADHFMPAGAKLGKSVALETPVVPEKGESDFERPKGRLLIYWGCGAKAAKGQPIIIDFAKLAAGQVPPDLYSKTILRDYGPTMANSRTFGRWPAKDDKYVKSDSSLIGAHRIAGNYSPEIAFTLAQDFMAPLNATTSGSTGAIPVAWTGVAKATGYFMWAFGARMVEGDDQPTDMVWWSSSATREFGGGLTDWLSPAQVAKLVQQKSVMAPTTSTCTIPAEVRRDAPDFLLGTVFAYGPEENFAYPPRPADAKARWDLVWTARVRHRSMSSFMIGMPAMGQEDAAAAPAPDKKKCKRGLGGMLGGVLGAPGC